MLSADNGGGEPGQTESIYGTGKYPRQVPGGFALQSTLGPTLTGTESRPEQITGKRFSLCRSLCAPRLGSRFQPDAARAVR